MKERIRAFILDELQKEYTIADTENVDELNYIAEGFISSLGIVQFIMSIEDEFDIEFTDDELASEEIKIVGSLAEMIENKIMSK